MGRRQVNSWLSIDKRNPDCTSRLVLFPYAGAGAAAFYQWAAPLFASFEIVTVHLPGREMRAGEPLLKDWRQVCLPVAEALNDIGDLPFAFFGHSMGALLAYETCRAAVRGGAPLPYLLAVSGRSAPHVKLLRQACYDMPRDMFFAEVRKLGGMTPEILAVPELLDYVEPILRADLELHDRYCHEAEPALHLPLLALGGDADTSFPLQDVAQWNQASTGPFHMHHFPGGHFFINPHRDAIASLLVHYCRQYLPVPGHAARSAVRVLQQG